MFVIRNAILLCAFVAAVAVPCLAQEPSLFIPEPIQVRMVTAMEPLRFDVYTSGPTLYGLTVTPTDVRDPDGKPVSVSFRIAGSAQIDARNAAHVTITALDASPFERLGDYRLALRIEAKTATDSTAKTLQVLKTATISRVRPSITVLGIRDRSVRLTRFAPLFSATRDDFPITVRNGSRSTHNVTITADPITTTGDTAEVVGGSITPVMVDVPPGDTALKLTIRAADAGTLQSRLHVEVAGHGEVEEIPFKLIVNDAPPLPFLTIFLGVFVAFGLNYLATRIRPEQENRFRVLQLQQRLTRLRLRTADKRPKIDRLSGVLNELVLSNSAGFSAEVRTKLETLGQETEALEKEIETDRQSVQQKIREVRASIDAVRGAADTEKVTAAANELARLESIASENRHADALAGLALLAASVVGLASATRGSRQDEEDLDDTQVAPGNGIRIVTVRNRRIAGRELVFEVVADVGPGALLRWNFGDGEAETHNRRARHTYAGFGSYPITVELPDGGIATADVDVEPSDLERGAEDAARRLVMSDLALSLIALVVATTTGLLMLYAGKTFGSLTNYLEAFLWGFGIDGSVRGFGNVFKKLMSNG